MVLALLSVRLVDEFAGFLPHGAFEAFRADLGLTYTQASVVLVAAAPGAILGNVFAVLADVRSRRVISSGGAFAFAAALTMFAIGHSFAALVIASLVLGCASTAMVDASEIALVGLAGDAPASQISRSFVFGSIGDLLGPLLLIGVAAAGLSWRIAFAAGALTATGYAMWLAASRFPAPPPREHGHSLRSTLRPIVRDRRVWYFGILAMLLGLLDENSLSFLIAYLERDLHITAAAATSVAAASIVGSLVGFLTTSRAGYQPSERTLLRHAIVIALTLLAAVTFRSVALIVAAELVFGYAVARYWIALKTRVVMVHPQRVGSVNAVVSTIEFSGFVLPILAGRLADQFGIRAGFGFSALVAVLTVMLIATCDRRMRVRLDPTSPDRTSRDQASNARAI